jgi:uncharacterized protein YbjT (DUF2867 family)
VSQQRTALVAGATGLVGHHLVQELIASPAWGEVRLLLRRPVIGFDHPKVRLIQVDWDRLADWHDAFRVDAVFCALGTTIKKAGSQAAFRRVDYDYPLALGRLALAEGAHHFALVSSLGADPKARLFYARVKGEVEEALRGLALPSLAIYRPSLLLGARSEFRLGERAAALFMRPFGPLFVGPLARYRAIHAATVARAMRLQAEAAIPGAHVYESEQIRQIGS